MHNRSAGLFIPFLLVFLFAVLAAGCISPAGSADPGQVSVTAATPTPAPAATIPNITAIVVTPKKTVFPTPAATISSGISAAELSARVTNARNQLNNLIDSDVADTIIIHPTPQQSCEIKKTRELGYQIDTVTGESEFAKGGYYSLDSKILSDSMVPGREYVIIHTHPKTWKKCPGSTIVSPNTFSIGDLEAVNTLQREGFRIRQLIAISDGRDYRIWPQQSDAWRSSGDIKQAVKRIENRLEQKFSSYDPILEQQNYDVDNLMPYLARELNYTYTINNNVIT